jgi:transposase
MNIDSDELHRMIEGGARNHEIAAHFGVSISTLVVHKRKHGLTQKKPYNYVNIDREELEKIVNDAVLGVEDTARHFGVSVPTIVRRMREFGLASKKGKGSPMEKNYFWNGGVRVSKGYIYLKCHDHPNRTKDGYVSEHRLVMEQKIGRYLLQEEVVHHADGNPQNNHPDNLELFQCNADHLRHELTGRTPKYSPAGLQRMRENARRINRRRLKSNPE